MNGIKYAHLSCNTPGEFKHNISRISRKKSYKILYLAFHGINGKILFDDESELGLNDLADIMKGRFKGWTIHFSSCNTLKITDEKLQDFITRTGISLVTGYTKTVGWAESAALDLLLLDRLQTYKNTKYLGLSIEKTYPDLAELNGFRFLSAG
jgi:hypothetical protein